MASVAQPQLASRATPVLASGDVQLKHRSERISISPVSSTSTGFRWCARASTASPTILRTARLVLANAATGVSDGLARTRRRPTSPRRS
eukprot:4402338-Prymnesium_polylepis.1